MTPDELKSIPKGSFVVMKTGTHPTVSYTHLDVYKRQGWRCRGSSMTKEERKLESKNITIGFDAAKLDALEFVLRKQRSSVQRRMEEVLQQLYESEVPEAVREYVDSKSAPAARPRRPAKASVTKQKEGDEHGTA